MYDTIPKVLYRCQFIALLCEIIFASIDGLMRSYGALIDIEEVSESGEAAEVVAVERLAAQEAKSFV